MAEAKAPIDVIGSGSYLPETWSETYARCRQLASALQRRGIGVGDGGRIWTYDYEWLARGPLLPNDLYGVSIPSYDVAYVGRGNIYRQRQRLDQALADYNRAIELDSPDPRAYHNRALVYQSLGQHPQAIQDFTTAIFRAPAAIEPYNGRGLSYLATADYKAAFDDFNRVVKQDRNSYEAWTKLALSLEKLGEFQQAYTAFSRAANLNPKYKPAKDGMKRLASYRNQSVGQG